MFNRLFVTEAPKSKKAKKDDKPVYKITDSILSNLEEKDVAQLRKTCKFFSTISKNSLLFSIETKIKNHIKEIEKLSKAIQQREPFLCNVHLDEFSAANFSDLKQKLINNQNELKKLFDDREFAKMFILSIPISVSLSFINYSIGLSIFKNLFLIYQSVAAMWAVGEHEFVHIKYSMIDLLITSDPDKLHKLNNDLYALCDQWIKVKAIEEKNSALVPADAEIDRLMDKKFK